MIVVGGDNLIDMIQTSPEGEPLRFAGALGGSAFNCAMALGRQGVDVGYTAPVSVDTLGKCIATRLETDGVQIVAPRSDAPTSLAVVTVDGGQPAYQFYRNGTAERLITAEILDTALSGAKVFHLASLAITDGVDAEIWADGYVKAHQSGIVTSIDPNIRATLIYDRETYLERLSRLFAASDIVKLSDEDLEWIYPDLTQNEALETLVEQTNAALVVLTRGENGATAVYYKGSIDLPAHAVTDLVDTVGAGDTFMATMLSGLSRLGALTRAALSDLTESQLRLVLENAAEAAAYNCSFSGCNPPKWETLARAKEFA